MTMIRKLSIKDITISETPDRKNFKVLFADDATVDVLEYIEKTEVGKSLAVGSHKVDS
jgi:hypothetical protein